MATSPSPSPRAGTRHGLDPVHRLTRRKSPTYCRGMATVTPAPDGPDVFAALASPVRRDLLRLLLIGPQPVNALAAHFAMRRPSVSEHLKLLKDAGLVTEERVGRQRVYQLRAEP